MDVGVFTLAHVHEGILHGFAFLYVNCAPLLVLVAHHPRFGTLHHKGEGLGRDGVELVGVIRKVAEIDTVQRLFRFFHAAGEPRKQGRGRTEKYYQLFHLESVLFTKDGDVTALYDVPGLVVLGGLEAEEIVTAGCRIAGIDGGTVGNGRL